MGSLVMAIDTILKTRLFKSLSIAPVRLAEPSLPRPYGDELKPLGESLGESEVGR